MWRRRACREALVVIASVAILEIGGPPGSGGPYIDTDEALSKSKKFLDDQESVSTEEDETAELISDHVEAKSAEQQCSDQQQVR